FLNSRSVGAAKSLGVLKMVFTPSMAPINSSSVARITTSQAPSGHSPRAQASAFDRHGAGSVGRSELDLDRVGTGIQGRQTETGKGDESVRHCQLHVVVGYLNAIDEHLDLAHAIGVGL